MVDHKREDQIPPLAKVIGVGRQQVEREIISYLGEVWTEMQRNYRNRGNVLPITIK